MFLLQPLALVPETHVEKIYSSRDGIWHADGPLCQKDYDNVNSPATEFQIRAMALANKIATRSRLGANLKGLGWRFLTLTERTLKE